MSFQARQAPFRELVIDAFANLYALRQRSALALLGIVIGTASVVAMLTIGHMAEREALKLFSHMGVNMLVARSSGGGPNLPGLDLATVESLPQREPAIEAATALSTGPLGTDLDLPGPPITVVAATPTLQDLAGLSVQSGRFITPVDADDLVAVLGAEAAAKLSKPGDAVGVGRQLRVGRYIFNVIGILAQAPATAFDPADFNTAIIIPLSGGRQATGQAAINAAMARMRPNADAKAAITALTSDLRAVSPKAQFQVQSARQLIATVKAQKAVHTRLLAAIGGISLLVGGIGVMNVMLMGVMERRREIGLRAAIGATPLDIQLGSRLNHIQKASTAASATADKKLRASLSYLVATRLKSLSRQKAFSTRWRDLYRALSSGILRFRLAFPGITGREPCLRISARR